MKQVRCVAVMSFDYLTVRHVEAIGCDSRLTVDYLQDQDRLDG